MNSTYRRIVPMNDFAIHQMLDEMRPIFFILGHKETERVETFPGVRRVPGKRKRQPVGNAQMTFFPRKSELLS